MKELIEDLKKELQKERKAEVEEMEKEMRSISGKEREKRGRAVLSLQSKIIGGEFGYKLVKLTRKKEILSEISIGDSVTISAGKSVSEGIVTETGSKHFIVATENPLSGEVRLDLSANDTTFYRMYENLENLSEEGARVLKFFLGERSPSFGEEEDLSVDLNREQREAVAESLRAEDFFLIHGPFGTGKTKTAAEVIRQEVRKGNRVLATSESNVATDNLAEELYGEVNIVRIGHPARISRSLKDVMLHSLMESDGSYSSVKKLRDMGEEAKEEQQKYEKPTLPKRKIMEMHFSKKKGKLSPHKVSSMAEWISLNEKADGYYEGARAMEEEISRRIINEAQVVVSTNSSSFTIEGEFDVVVMDEAPQATLPSSLIPLSKAPRFILAGDHKQLPPTLKSSTEILQRTLFKVLIKRFPESSLLLKEQYRMNEKLMRFPSNEFYDGKLKASSLVKDITLCDLGVQDSVVFEIFDTSIYSDRFEKRKKDSFSIYNEREAEMVVQTLKNLLSKGLKKENIGIITPYDDQAELITRKCGMEAYTVDGYQGQEREVMILSLVRSNKKGEIGFLNDMRRLNVSLTRAKRKLVVIGDRETLSCNATYRRLFTSASS